MSILATFPVVNTVVFFVVHSEIQCLAGPWLGTQVSGQMVSRSCLLCNAFRSFRMGLHHCCGDNIAFVYSICVHHNTLILRCLGSI